MASTMTHCHGFNKVAEPEKMEGRKTYEVAGFVVLVNIECRRLLDDGKLTFSTSAAEKSLSWFAIRDDEC